MPAGKTIELSDDDGCGTLVTANVPNICLPRMPDSTGAVPATKNGTANGGCPVEVMLNRAISVMVGNIAAAGRHADDCLGDF